MPRTSNQIFIWIPQKYTSLYNILVDGTDHRENTIKASFSKAVAPEVGTFKIVLDNNNGEFNNRYFGGEEVEFQYDFGGGTTRRFLGVIEELRDSFGAGGSQMEVIGSHVTGELLDRTVIASYDGSITADAVIKDLIDRFSPSGFTSTNVNSSSVSPAVNFNGVPLWKALSEITKIANFHLYVDDSKDLHFFEKGSVLNDDEAVIFGDTLIVLNGLGKDTLDIRNKIQVYGDDGGLPIVYTASDVSSTTNFGLKESVIQGKDIKSDEVAKSIGDAQLAAKKENADVGSGRSWMLKSLNPGDNVYISSTPHNILGRFPFVKFTHIIPEEFTDFEIEDTRSLDKLFRARIEKDIALEEVTNPFNLEQSFHFSFDDNNKFDPSTGSNVGVANGKLILTSGSDGTFISKAKTASEDIEKVHVKALGEDLGSATFAVSADNGNNWQDVVLNELTTVINKGKSLRLRVTFNADTARIDAAVILFT